MNAEPLLTLCAPVQGPTTRPISAQDKSALDREGALQESTTQRALHKRALHRERSIQRAQPEGAFHRHSRLKTLSSERANTNMSSVLCSHDDSETLEE